MQSTAKTFFLIISMIGWLGVGGALIYLGPELYQLLSHSEQAQQWLENLLAGGYNPRLGLLACGILFPLELIGNWYWYTQVEKK